MAGAYGLVLARHLGEKILVGKKGDVLQEPLVITLVSITSANQAKIAIRAPKSLTVIREELLTVPDEKSNLAGGLSPSTTTEKKN